METDAQKAAALLGPLAVHVDSFLDDLRAAGYAPPAVTKRQSIVTAFIRWGEAEPSRYRISATRISPGS